MRRFAFALTFFCLAPALKAEGPSAALTFMNRRAEVEAGGRIMDIEVKDHGNDVHLEARASLGVLKWYDDSRGIARLHADAAMSVDHWRWTFGALLDFEKASRPGVGLRLTGGHMLGDHVFAGLSAEVVTAPDAAVYSAGTRGAVGLHLGVTF